MFEHCHRWDFALTCMMLWKRSVNSEDVPPNELQSRTDVTCLQNPIHLQTLGRPNGSLYLYVEYHENKLSSIWFMYSFLLTFILFLPPAKYNFDVFSQCIFHLLLTHGLKEQKRSVSLRFGEPSLVTHYYLPLMAQCKATQGSTCSKGSTWLSKVRDAILFFFK